MELSLNFMSLLCTQCALYPFQSVCNSKHQALVCFCGVFCTVTGSICHAGTSLMDKVFIHGEEHPYVIEADGTFDIATLQLQPATVVINGYAVITPTSSCRQKLGNRY